MGYSTIEDQKELLQLLIKEIGVYSFDPEKEKAPRENGAFVTKIRTKWYKIRLNLYQIPEIYTFYKDLAKRKESSDFQGNWLPVADDVRTRIIKNKNYFYVPDLKR